MLKNVITSPALQASSGQGWLFEACSDFYQWFFFFVDLLFLKPFVENYFLLAAGFHIYLLRAFYFSLALPGDPPAKRNNKKAPAFRRSFFVL
ncbi:hypothetical protein CLOLEP_03738 [[Clostridium] leptum DSM 753]|uniref:Uncharacterized protein n=1 Tax=[Clostridium] leptum DSM 753 TaxID=428125 RepID=A7VYR0_9FIRM|nr:hypothetical protein CLOLEP_03738 [[Clostridium] leptum DSM 753]MCC3320769.1 hypothetical protein [[Clostridium] innocuum]PEQ25239.1 hypothetical protein CH238_04185 [[Clostridium] leptum DSM 753]